MASAPRYALAAIMVLMGTLHFVRPEPFVDIVPDLLPAPRLLLTPRSGGIHAVVKVGARLSPWSAGS